MPTCQKCNSENAPGVHFCTACGNNLQGEDPAVPPTATTQDTLTPSKKGKKGVLVLVLLLMLLGGGAYFKLKMPKLDSTTPTSTTSKSPFQAALDKDPVAVPEDSQRQPPATPPKTGIPTDAMVLTDIPENFPKDIPLDSLKISAIMAAEVKDEGIQLALISMLEKVPAQDTLIRELKATGWILTDSGGGYGFLFSKGSRTLLATFAEIPEIPVEYGGKLSQGKN